MEPACVPGREPSEWLPHREELRLLPLDEVRVARVRLREACEFTLDANQRRAVGLVVLLQVIGEHQPRGVVLWFGERSAKE
jgi:hypothetical protein